MLDPEVVDVLLPVFLEARLVAAADVVHVAAVDAGGHLEKAHSNKLEDRGFESLQGLCIFCSAADVKQ
jgi:hypothetical protein